MIHCLEIIKTKQYIYIYITKQERKMDYENNIRRAHSSTRL